MAYRFFSEGIKFKLPHPRKTRAWIKLVAEKERLEVNEINYIFCNDEHLLEINRKFLNHNSLTDIITFSYSKSPITSDIFISIPRVKENALTFERPFEEELHRVLVHGLLHLAGYKDKKKPEKVLMRKKEEAYLSLRS
jgi:rRNA maturation RNase YbeY